MRSPSTRAALSAIALTATLLFGGAAWAGRSCEPRPLTPQSMERGLALAARSAAALDASGARVVVLARAGQDLSKYGLRYSHLGFAYRAQDAQGQPVWRVVHKLNQCGSDRSTLYRQGLAEFFGDGLYLHDRLSGTRLITVPRN